MISTVIKQAIKPLFMVAQTISENSRQVDQVARYGGEEFLVLCPGTDEQAAYDLAERLRTAIAGLGNTGLPPITCSIGLATLTAKQSLDDLINAADKALYSAKNSGRNRVLASALQ
jgi:diguanylate cyclase (GGDEF)-like protein